MTKEILYGEKMKLSGRDEVEKGEWERPEAGFRYFTVRFRKSRISETYFSVHGEISSPRTSQLVDQTI